MRKRAFAFWLLWTVAGCRSTPPDTVEAEEGSTPAETGEVLGRAQGFGGVLGGGELSQSGSTDLDADGQLDRWRYEQDGGTGFQGFRVKVQLTSGEPPFTLDAFASRGDFLTVIPRPKALASSADLESRLLVLLFGAEARRTLDDRMSPRGHDEPQPSAPSPQGGFEWLIDWSLSSALPVQEPFVDRRVLRPETGHLGRVPLPSRDPWHLDAVAGTLSVSHHAYELTTLRRALSHR